VKKDNINLPRKCYYTPQKIEGFENIALISCGDNFSLAISKDGIVYNWGRIFIEENLGKMNYSHLQYPVRKEM
jgi:alpha-tubulin suppressor-like RCC1 family protein